MTSNLLCIGIELRKKKHGARSALPIVSGGNALVNSEKTKEVEAALCLSSVKKMCYMHIQEHSFSAFLEVNQMLGVFTASGVC